MWFNRNNSEGARTARHAMCRNLAAVIAWHPHRSERVSARIMCDTQTRQIDQHHLEAGDLFQYSDGDFYLFLLSMLKSESDAASVAIGNGSQHALVSIHGIPFCLQYAQQTTHCTFAGKSNIIYIRILLLRLTSACHRFNGNDGVAAFHTHSHSISSISPSFSLNMGCCALIALLCHTHTHRIGRRRAMRPPPDTHHHQQRGIMQ